MSTKSKRARSANKKVAANRELGETLKKRMIESIVFMERLATMRNTVGPYLSQDDTTLIGYAGNSELDNFRELLAQFLTSRGIAVTTVDTSTSAAA